MASSTPGATPRSPLQRLPLLFAFGMIAASLTVVAGARLTGFEPAQEIGGGEVLQSRLLRFERDGAGDVRVVDAASGETIAAAGREGFVPGVLRGLDRLRRTSAASPTEAYRLERLSNGQLLLTDTASGVSLDLNAYGHGNAQVFKAFLPTTGDKS